MQGTKETVLFYISVIYAYHWIATQCYKLKNAHKCDTNRTHWLIIIECSVVYATSSLFRYENYTSNYIVHHSQHKRCSETHRTDSRSVFHRKIDPATMAGRKHGRKRSLGSSKSSSASDPAKIANTIEVSKENFLLTKNTPSRLHRSPTQLTA